MTSGSAPRNPLHDVTEWVLRLPPLREIMGQRLPGLELEALAGDAAKRPLAPYDVPPLTGICRRLRIDDSEFFDERWDDNSAVRVKLADGGVGLCILGGPETANESARLGRQSGTPASTSVLGIGLGNPEQGNQGQDEVVEAQPGREVVGSVP